MFKFISNLVGCMFLIVIVIVVVVSSVLVPSVGTAIEQGTALLTRILCGLIFGAIALAVCNAYMADKEAREAKTATINAQFEYWLYHRPTDKWIPANGSNSQRGWWSLDWDRWLTQQELEARVHYSSTYKTRLKVFDRRDTAKQAWRDECEVWTYTPFTQKWLATSISSTDCNFMSF